MKNIGLRGLSLLLVFALLFSFAAVFTVSAAVKTGDKIVFGSYPAAKVRDEALTAALEGVQKTWRKYGYSTVVLNENGTLREEESDIRFADFFYQGEKYRAVRFSIPLREATGALYGETFRADQEDNGYAPGTYYFKYQPLIWRVLNANTGMLVSERILDAHVSPGDARVWLQTDFIDTAFSLAQKKKLVVSSLNADDPYIYNDGRHGDETPAVPVYDRVFLLSKKQAENAAYGFSSDGKRFATGTDYAACMGLEVNMETGGAPWALRTLSAGVNNSGRITPSLSGAHVGMRPVIRLSTVAENKEVSEILYSERSRRKPGDVDCDGKTTAADARLALRAAVELESYAPDAVQFAAADVDYDYAVTAADARLILRAAVRLDLLFYSKMPDGVHYDVDAAEPEEPVVLTDYDVLRSGHFSLTAVETSDKGVIPIQMAMDGKRAFYSSSTVDGVSLGVLVRDGSVTLISDKTRSYTQPSDANLARLGISVSDFTAMAENLSENAFPPLTNAEEIGADVFGGVTCKTYTFRDDDRELTVYMNGLTLVGLRRVQDGEETVMRVSKVEEGFPTLPPEGYTEKTFAAFILSLFR